MIFVIFIIIMIISIIIIIIISRAREIEDGRDSLHANFFGGPDSKGRILREGLATVQCIYYNNILIIIIIVIIRVGIQELKELSRKFVTTGVSLPSVVNT